MFRRRSPEEKVQAELSTMREERADNERNMTGLMNRPRYIRAKQRLTDLGVDAVEPLIELIEETPAAPSDYEQRTTEDEVRSGLAADAGDVLAAIGDPRAVAPMLERIHDFHGLHYALAKTPEGVEALIGALADPERDFGIRYSAASGLGAATALEEDAMQALLNAVTSRTPGALGPAVESLGILGKGDRRAADALRDVATDERVEVGIRTRAEKRLSSFGF